MPKQNMKRVLRLLIADTPKDEFSTTLGGLNY